VATEAWAYKPRLAQSVSRRKERRAPCTVGA
jgi:hypothetical protein